jgi:serine O-acetyltransferase
MSTGLRRSLQPLSALVVDIKASSDTDGATHGRFSWVAIARILFTARLQAVFLLRLGQAVHSLFPPVAAFVKYANTVLTGADIALAASIGPGLRLFHPVGVVIGPDCIVGNRCTILQGTTLGAGVGGSPVLGDDVFVGAGAKIFGRVTIGARSVVGANAVVLNSVPDNSFVGGIPAKVIKTVSDPHQVHRP